MDRRKFVRNSLVAAGAVAVVGGANNDLVKGLTSSPEPFPKLPAAGFTFARARYGSGNWDADPKMPSNILNSLVEYTSIRVDPEEVVIDLDSEEIFTFPFLYLTGNKLVRLTKKERENFGRYVSDGGFIFVDDCNHDIDGVFAKTL